MLNLLDLRGEGVDLSQLKVSEDFCFLHNVNNVTKSPAKPKIWKLHTKEEKKIDFEIPHRANKFMSTFFLAL